MHRPIGRRRSAARIIGWGLVAIVYAAVLVWAGGLTAAEPAARVGTEPEAGALNVAAGEVGEELAAVAAIQTPAEAPLVTLGIAVAIVAAGGAWYGIRAIRARQPRLARTARLVVRHITTLQ
jgi:hypothetical protein